MIENKTIQALWGNLPPDTPVQVFLPYPNTRWRRAAYLRRSEHREHLVVRLDNGTEEHVHMSLVRPEDRRPLPDDPPRPIAPWAADPLGAARKVAFWVVDYDVGEAATHWVTADKDAIEPYIQNLCRAVTITNVRITALYRSSVSTPYPLPPPPARDKP